MIAAVRISGLTHRFGTAQTDRVVLRDVSFSVASGAVVLLTGRSGSGKSTLLTLIGGLRRVQSGSVNSLGRELGQLTPTELANFRRSVRFIFQQHHLLDSLSAIQNVEAGLTAFGGRKSEITAASRYMLAAVGLGDRLHARRRELSGGEQQRVAIARALVSKPALLLADEPTAFLDKRSSTEVATLIRGLAADLGCTVLIATHDDRITHMADERFMMEDGRVIQATHASIA